jgi:hydroxymethylglutaryl-CoA lyase
MNFDALAPAAMALQGLLGHPLPSAVGRAGPRWQRHPVPADFEETRQRALAREAAM